jgi:hypothetical protein
LKSANTSAVHRRQVRAAVDISSRCRLTEGAVVLGDRFDERGERGVDIIAEVVSALANRPPVIASPSRGKPWRLVVDLFERTLAYVADKARLYRRARVVEAPPPGCAGRRPRFRAGVGGKGLPGGMSNRRISVRHIDIDAEHLAPKLSMF